MATPPAPAEYSDRAHIVTALNPLAPWSRFGRGDGCTLHEPNDAIWFDTPGAHPAIQPGPRRSGVAAGKDGTHDSATVGGAVSTPRIATVAAILRASVMHFNTRERATNA